MKGFEVGSWLLPGCSVIEYRCMGMQIGAVRNVQYKRPALVDKSGAGGAEQAVYWVCGMDCPVGRVVALEAIKCQP